MHHAWVVWKFGASNRLLPFKIVASNYLFQNTWATLVASLYPYWDVFCNDVLEYKHLCHSGEMLLRQAYVERDEVSLWIVIGLVCWGLFVVFISIKVKMIDSLRDYSCTEQTGSNLIDFVDDNSLLLFCAYNWILLMIMIKFSSEN